MLTVQSLLDELELEPAAGAKSLANPVRWVHISELEDPTPWLSGGELMLTTGIQLSGAAKQRAFVKRLVNHNLAGLGFGTGFDHRKLPKALVDEAEQARLPALRGALLDAVHRPHREGVRAAGQRAVRGAAARHRGAAAARAPGARGARAGAARRRRSPRRSAARCWCSTGTASRSPRAASAASSPEAVAVAIRSEAAAHVGDGHPFVPAHASVAGRALAHPVVSPGGGPPQAWVVIVRDSGGLGDFERLILQQAVVVVALELMRRRVERETERRLAGDVLAGGAQRAPRGGRAAPPPGAVRDRGRRPSVLVFSVDDPSAAEAALEAALAEAGCPAVVAPHASRRARAALRGDRRLRAATRSRSRAAARRALAGRRGGVRAAASRPASPEALRRSFHEARCALEATALDNGEAPDVASWQDLGAFTLLLSLQDDEALRLYCESVLGPIEDGDAEYGGELLRSLEAFIENNGQWERAAREVYCHRHTLRYRMRKVEELTGRDLEPRPRPDRVLARAAGQGARRDEGRGARRGGDDRAGDRARPRRLRGGRVDPAARPARREGRRRWRPSTGSARRRARGADARSNLAAELAGVRRARQLGQLPGQPRRDAGLPGGRLPLPRPRRPLPGDRRAAAAGPRLRARRAASRSWGSAPAPARPT